MGHKQDFWERLRLHLARPLGALTTGTRCRKEDPVRFVGYVEMGEEEFEEKLHEMNFHRNPLAYWKKTVDVLGEEEGSWRKTDGEWQIHTVLYSRDEYPERTYIYAHWEKRWDVDPIGHLRGTGLDIPKGVNEMRRELQLASINYHNDPTIQ